MPTSGQPWWLRGLLGHLREALSGEWGLTLALPIEEMSAAPPG